MFTPTRRQTLGALIGVIGAGLSLWTLRSTWPDRQASTDRWDHYLPMSGKKLFQLTYTPGVGYSVQNRGADCEQTEVGLDEELRCDGRRFYIREALGRHLLVLEGMAIPFESTIGTGRDADFVWPLPGVAAKAWRTLPPDRCAPEGTEQPIACIENLGGDASLVVDRSIRQNDAHPLPATRVALKQGQILALDERDLLWAGHVPLRPRAEKGLLLWSIPAEDWSSLGGDRRWMSLELPQWRLSDVDTSAVETHTFWSRTAAFRNSAFPLAWDTHLLDRRVEFEQEEKLQAFVDHQLLCYDSVHQKMRWNLRTGKGCDGVASIQPPAGLYREAEQAAYQPGMSRILELTDASLSVLPEQTPDPAAMVFVFDWAWQRTDHGDRRVPTAVIGVRPGSTRNGPPPPVTKISSSDECQLAKQPAALPPIRVSEGSTSSYLEVTGGTLLAPGSRLLLPATGILCLNPGASTEGMTRLEPGASAALAPAPSVYTLGKLQIQTSKAGSLRWWSPDASTPKLKNSDGICVQFNKAAVWTAAAVGDITQLRIGETIAENASIPLADGQSLHIGPPNTAVELRFHDAADKDLAAVSRVQQDHIERLYPFGADLSPLSGYGTTAGGLEGATERQRWNTAKEAWIKRACGEPTPPAPGLDLTLRGDLERIVAGELAAMANSCKNGDPRCPSSGEDVTGSAVLLDSRSGAILAAASFPSFEPNDPVQVEQVEQALRTAGPTGIVRLPTLENKAFLRANNAGSVYKLATAYALASAGKLGETGPLSPSVSCTRFAIYSASAAPYLTPSTTPDGTRSQPCGKRSVILSEGGAQFHDAFRFSINLYFGLAPFALLPASDVHYGAPKHISDLGEPPRNPHQDKAGLWLWTHGPPDHLRADLGLTLAPEFDVSTDLNENNAYISNLVALGHRFHYPRAGGGTLYTQRLSGVADIHFPTAERPWLPGLQTGAAFRYPSMVGPQAYAFEGVPGWASRELTLTLHKGDDAEETAFTAATSSIREYSRSAYGMGGVEASALSLAVMATPMARPDGSAISPSIFQDTVLPLGRIQAPTLVREGREPIESAMRAVVSEPGSTAYGYFSKDIAERIGGKTGTFEIVRGRHTDPAPAASAFRRIAEHGCGMIGVEPKADDWKQLKSSLLRLSPRRQKNLPVYVVKILDQLSASPPPRGFAASASLCQDGALNPGRPGVGITVSNVDAGQWLDALQRALPSDDDDDLVEGSSFIAVVFDGLAEASGPGKPPPGQGWVLTVIIDGHPTGAKRASARILERLRQYTLARRSSGIE